MPRFKIPDVGEVYFHAAKLPGCCGVCVIHDIKFYPKTLDKRKRLFYHFNKFLQRRHQNYATLNRAVLMVSDYEGGLIAQFAKHAKWRRANKPVHNRKSGRKVVVYTCEHPDHSAF